MTLRSCLSVAPPPYPPPTEGARSIMPPTHDIPSPRSGRADPLIRSPHAPFFRTWYAPFASNKRKGRCARNGLSCLRSGNYLSSRVVGPSTFGVRELNFCVRDGNRWILSAIVTGMVYKTHEACYIGGVSLKVSPFNDVFSLAKFSLLPFLGGSYRKLSPQTDNYTANTLRQRRTRRNHSLFPVIQDP